LHKRRDTPIYSADAVQMQRRKAKMDTQPQSPADKPPTRGGILDGRTRRGRRRRELIKAYSTALGGDAALTDGQRIDVRKAAELTALAEDCRALAMQQGAGGPGAISALVRLESSSARAIRALRLPPPNHAEPTLSHYLAAHEAEHEHEKP
jgi:hypothetical protein